jgi:hypothetical protein
LSIAVDRLPTPENYVRFPFLFAAKTMKLGVFRFTMETWRHQTENANAQAIFLNPFTVCSSCKWNFIVCPFVEEETNGCYPFAKGLNGLSGLAHLYLYLYKKVDFLVTQHVCLSQLTKCYILLQFN